MISELHCATVVPSLRRRDVCHKFLIVTRVPSAERRDYGNVFLRR